MGTELIKKASIAQGTADFVLKSKKAWSLAEELASGAPAKGLWRRLSELSKDERLAFFLTVDWDAPELEGLRKKAEAAFGEMPSVPDVPYPGAPWGDLRDWMEHVFGDRDLLEGIHTPWPIRFYSCCKGISRLTPFKGCALYKSSVFGYTSTYAFARHTHSGYALTNHNHDATYAQKSHDHDATYAAKAHDHDAAYAGIAHNHDAAYAQKSHDHDATYAAKTHDHDATYAGIAHNHDAAYAQKSHDHDGDYAAKTHDHDAAYAGIAHNHDAAYAQKSHDHDGDYAAASHDHAGYVRGAAAVSGSLTYAGSPGEMYLLVPELDDADVSRCLFGGTVWYSTATANGPCFYAAATAEKTTDDKFRLTVSGIGDAAGTSYTPTAWLGRTVKLSGLVVVRA